MIETLRKNWWLLALCGILDAAVSGIYLSHYARNLGFNALSAIVVVGNLTLAAGLCAVACGIWRSITGKSWLLVLNGLALGALGLVLNGIFGFRISLRAIALLIILTAMPLAIGAMRTPRQVANKWFTGLVGVGAIGFVLAFLFLGLGWIRVQPGALTDLLWLGAYFAFSAICMLALALRLHTPSWRLS